MFNRIKIIFIALCLLCITNCFAQDTLIFELPDTSNNIASDSVIKLFPDTTIFTDSTETIEDIDFELILAAERGNAYRVLYLLNKGADVNTDTYNGITPLMYAAQNGHDTIVNILVLNGAKVNAEPYSDIGALMGAVIHNHEDIADYLIRNGAYINAADENKVTSLMYAATYGYYIMCDMLIFYGADITLEDYSGNNALLLAVYTNNTGVVELLLSKGADINSQDNKGYTPLMIAAGNNYLEMAELLTDKDAVIDPQNTKGLTPLNLAIVNGHKEMVEFLIKKGADVNLEISPSRDPYTLAWEYNNKELKEVLLSNGAKKNRRPEFSRISIGMDFIWAFYDFMYGWNFGLQESKYKISASLGINTRPFYKKILVETEIENTYYQFLESRTFIHLEVSKRTAFFRFAERNEIGLSAGLKPVYTFGKYKGMKKRAENRFLLVPRAGVYYSSYYTAVMAGYEYMDFDIYKGSPHWMNISFIFYINLNKNKISNKEVYWLE